jgi:hypothetical protein
MQRSRVEPFFTLEVTMHGWNFSSNADWLVAALLLVSVAVAAIA